MRLIEPDALGPLAEAEGTPRAACLAYVRANAPAAMPGDAPLPIANVRTRLGLVDTGRDLLPLSVNDGDEDAVGPRNSWVVSPGSTYADYADAEIARLPQPLLVPALRGLVRAAGGLLRRARIDRVVQPNNWLLSTNVYPADWEGDGLEAITQALTTRWPDHALAWRSLNGFSNAALISRLRALGYLLLPSRQVYLFDGRAGAAAPFRDHHNVRLDATLLRRTAYRVVPGEALVEADFPRLARLYAQLYLEKYPALNPQYGAGWLWRGQRDGWLRLCALRSPAGRLDGVVGWFGHAALLTAPIVGYDTALPQRLGLYRLLTQLCLQEAAARRVVLNFSAGAAQFKRLRGGRPVIESSLVCVRHLPRPRRLAWQALAATLRGVAVPLMQGLRL